MFHPFFDEVQNYADLAEECNLNIKDLPEAYFGKNKIKAILLGADPTNNGIKDKPGLIELKTVFGIGSEYERYFFNPQLKNLSDLGISKDNLFLQNVCRNYFINQTGLNKKWFIIADLWIKYLKLDIEKFEDIPILVTAEKIMRALTDNNTKAELLYKHPDKYLPVWSELLEREVYPLYRHPNYFLSKQNKYRNYLKTKLN